MSNSQEQLIEISAISMDESRRLIALESIINAGLKTFVEVGEALLEIRDSRLYRIEHSTFEDYCREKWQMSKQRANQLVSAASVVDTISKTTTIVVTPKTESQARPLTKLTPEKQIEAWSKAVKSSGGEQPTAKIVQEAVLEVMPTKPVAHQASKHQAPSAARKRLRAAAADFAASVSEAVKLKKMKPSQGQWLLQKMPTELAILWRPSLADMEKLMMPKRKREEHEVVCTKRKLVVVTETRAIHAEGA